MVGRGFYDFYLYSEGGREGKGLGRGKGVVRGKGLVRGKRKARGWGEEIGKLGGRMGKGVEGSRTENGFVKGETCSLQTLSFDT